MASGTIADGSTTLQGLADALKSAQDLVILFGDAIRGQDVHTLVQWGLGLQGVTRFGALGDYANSRGAADMGQLPGSLPGYAALTEESARQKYETVWGHAIPTTPGRDIRSIAEGIEAGKIKAVLVFGSNPAKTFGLSKATLAKLEYLFVAELFPTETAECADVVVPATSFAEKSGTFTNTFGQVQAIKRTMRKSGTKSDLEIVLALARLFGHRWTYQSADDVLREIIAQVPGYAIALPNLLIGRAISTRPEGAPPQLERPDLVFSSRDSLFSSGTLSQYSGALNSVDEARKPYGHEF